MNLFIPLYLDAIEYYLQIDFQTYINNHPSNVKGTINPNSMRDRFIRIRYKSIQILMSIASLPFCYNELEQHLFEDYLEKSHDVQMNKRRTFAEYRSRILHLLCSALQSEHDATNVQLLFGEREVLFSESCVMIFHSGTIRLACSLTAHYKPVTENAKKGN